MDDDSKDSKLNITLLNGNQNHNEWQIIQRRKYKVAPLAPLVSTCTNDSPWITAVSKFKSDKSDKSDNSRHLIHTTSSPRGLISNPRDIGHNKQYHRLREISSIIGFVVNIHDATNFDIDLQLTAEMRNKYYNVITNEYTYNDLGDEYVTNPNNVMDETLVPQTGITYRCRLRGIGINQLPSSDQMRKSYIMTTDIKQLLDRTDNWVSCTLSDIDVYQRLLVDVFVHTVDGCVNIKDDLLMKDSKDNNNPLFYVYTRESRENKNTLSK